MGRLSRKCVLMDDRGRITVPEYMRKALGIELEKGENVPLYLDAYPDLKDCKSIIIKR